MKFTKHLAVAFAALLVLSALGGSAMAATATVDTETTTTTTTSDLVAGSTLTAFNASAASSSYVEIQFDAAPTGDAVMTLTDPATKLTGDKFGEEVYKNASAVDLGTNHFAWTISHDEWSKLPMDAGENKTFTVHVYDSQDKANETTFDVHFLNTNERTVVRVGDAAVDEDNDDAFVEIEAKHSRLADFSDYFAGNIASLDSTSATNGSETTITYVLAEEETAEAFEDASEDADDGEWLTAVSMNVEGNYVPVFYEEENDDWDFLDSDEAYAVYNDDDGTVDLYLNGDEDFEDKTELDVELSANNNMGFRNAISMFGDLGAGALDTYVKSLSAQSVL